MVHPLRAATFIVLVTIGCQGGGAAQTSAGTGGAPGSSGSSSSTGGMGGASHGSTGGSAPIDAGPACSPDVPRSVPLQVWAEPDAGQAPFVDALSTAKTSIRVMVYDMGFGG